MRYTYTADKEQTEKQFFQVVKKQSINKSVTLKKLQCVKHPVVTKSSRSNEILAFLGNKVKKL